jgi:hypothetical protein
MFEDLTNNHKNENMNTSETLIQEITESLKKKNSFKIEEIRKVKDSLDSIKNQSEIYIQCNEELSSDQSTEYATSIFKQTVSSAEKALKLEKEFRVLTEKSLKILKQLEFSLDLLESKILTEETFIKALLELKVRVEAL